MEAIKQIEIIIVEPSLKWNHALVQYTTHLVRKKLSNSTRVYIKSFLSFNEGLNALGKNTRIFLFDSEEDKERETSRYRVNQIREINELLETNCQIISTPKRRMISALAFVIGELSNQQVQTGQQGKIAS